MHYSIFRPIVMGMLVGLGLFVVSMVMIRVLFFALIAALIFKAVSRSRGAWRFRGNFADHIRNMSEAEYAQFRQGGARPWANANYQHYPHTQEREVEVRPIYID